MLPISLKIRNFLAYRSPDALRFDGIHLACLTGANGAGKSSLLDAITWALWGKARARRDEELIHLGEQDMYVEMDFEHEGTIYRVIRHRSRKRGGESRLDLFVVRPDGSVENRSQPSIRTTQDWINQLLRLDYETFVHSAFLQQGKADAFTMKPPAQRKQILSDILGLAQWEHYEESVKTRLKSITEELAFIKARMADIDTELMREPGLRADLARAQEAHFTIQQTLLDAEIELEQFSHAPIELQNAQARQKEAVRRLEDHQKEIAVIDAQITEQQNLIKSYQADIDARVSIEEGYAALQAARNADHALGDKLRLLREMDEQRYTLEKHISATCAELENEASGYEATIAGLQRTIDRVNAGELDSVQYEVSVLQALEEQRDVLSKQVLALETERAGLMASKEALTTIGKGLKDRVERLENAEGATCPVCGQPLAEDRREELIDELNVELEQHRADYRGNQDGITRIKGEIVEIREKDTLTDAEIKRLRPSIERAGALQAQYEAAQLAEVEVATVQVNLTTVRKMIASEAYALDARSHLSALEAERIALGYDSDSHDAAKQQVQTYRDFEVRFNALQMALKTLPLLNAALEGLLRRGEILSGSAAAEQAQIDETVEAIDYWKPLVAEYLVRQEEVNRLRSDERKANERVIVANQELEALDQQRTRREKLEVDRAQKMHEEALYEELKKAFGKNGIPAMIIETVIPELEATANNLLMRMTDGRMSLRLTTQREKVTGGVAETLDIEIADELGTRAYELYSGGEAFRINFALRIALSQLLARRAGAHLRTLFIDEGFGTQDDDGRNKLVEAINAIQTEFDMILIITHLEDLRDSFPVHIVIEKTPHGSRIAVR